MDIASGIVFSGSIPLLAAIFKLVGNFTTSLDMAGGSITLTKLDKQITEHWDSPVHTAALRWKM